MTIEAVVVLLALLVVIGLLAFTRIAADAVMVAALTALLAIPVPTDSGWRMGVIDVGDALSGFSNAGMATVGVLFIVVTGLRETGGVDWIAQRALGRPRTLRGALVRVIAPVTTMSAFLNNTPVVAMLIPAVQDWSKRLGVQPSKLMIPLSYAAIMGGTCTLIGTSTNLVVAGLVMAQTDLVPISMFEIAKVGFPSALIGAAFLLIVGPRLLPSRGSAASALADPREYTMELMVPTGSGLSGKTVEQAGLRALPGCFLIEIEREERSIAPVGPEERILTGDRLVFAGVVESIRDLARVRGLAPATDQVFKLDSPRYRRRLFEAVVSESCPIAHRTIREGRFRDRYNAAVVAVARNGERVQGKLGEIQLRPGDTLLVEAEAGFDERMRDQKDFLLVSALADSTPRRHGRALVAIAILIAMVALATSGAVSMLVAALLASGLMILSRCCTISEARRSVDWSVLIVIGAALGFGGALESSGAAGAVAGAMLSVAGQNPWLALLAVYAVTSLLTEVVTNNAAVALVFPIAMAASERMGVSFMPFVMAIMMAGSASFATPLGYQTNLMVYGPGGYRFGDFLRIGVPMNLLLGVVTVALAPLIWPF